MRNTEVVANTPKTPEPVIPDPRDEQKNQKLSAVAGGNPPEPVIPPPRDDQAKTPPVPIRVT